MCCFIVRVERFKASLECVILNCLWECVTKKIPDKMNSVGFFHPGVLPNIRSCKRENFFGTFSIQLHHDTTVQEFATRASLL